MLAEDFDKNWVQFKRVIERPQLDFTVFVPLKAGSNHKLDKIDTFGTAIIRDSTKIARDVELGDFSGRLPAWIAKVVIQAQDDRSAAHAGYDKVAELLDILSFEKDRRIATLHDTVFVDYEDLDGKRRTTPAKGRRGYRLRHYDREIAPVKSIIAGGEPNVSHRVRSSMQYLSLSIQAHSLPVRYVNAWVALESLVRGPGSSFENIRKYIPCIHSTQYTRALLENFIEDCRRCGVDLKGVLGSPPANDRTDNTIKLLQRMQTQSAQNEIIRACNVHDLLEIRAKDLVQSMGTGPKLARLLSAHHERVTWHLFRLYRIRNSIVHAATAPKITLPCLAHLYDYIFITLRELCHVVTKHCLTSVHQGLALLYNEYHLLLDNLEHGNGDTMQRLFY